MAARLFSSFKVCTSAITARLYRVDHGVGSVPFLLNIGENNALNKRISVNHTLNSQKSCNFATNFHLQVGSLQRILLGLDAFGY